MEGGEEQEEDRGRVSCVLFLLVIPFIVIYNDREAGICNFDDWGIFMRTTWFSKIPDESW